jgi:hypothetical protein
MPDPKQSPSLEGVAAEQHLRRLTRRSFVTGGVAALAGLEAWRWLSAATPEDGVPWPLRRVLRFNQGLVECLGSPHGLAPTFSAESVRGPARTNGLVGLANEVEGSGWRLIVQHEDRAAVQSIPLRDVEALPHLDLVTELKCVEGWSEVMQFGGVRFLDFVTHFGLATRSGRAPDLSLDIASALHPQTLLCDTMNWRPLSRTHGAPLRLYLTVKYGFKSLKRVGLIRFGDNRPADYWADRGYDWYAGL